MATTTIAGVSLARRGIATPVGSLTQLATIRLGKRTEGRTPRIEDFLPLAGLDQIAFGGWEVRIEFHPPRGDGKEGWDNIDLFGWLGYPMQSKVDFLCRDSILAARAGLEGTQEWLSFSFKSPMTAPAVYPEHDRFIQSMKLENTMRWMMGEELITHLGRDHDG